MDAHSGEVASGGRFEFGKNWARFLRVLDESRIVEAENSLKTTLEVESLEGRSFLDVGSGSGLFSLAARRLGARVFSFDYDAQSVACTKELRSRFFQNDGLWTVERGSILDDEYIRALPKFDIVYSWGVLHHTGNMWRAMENVLHPLEKDGRLYIAIYNDQGHWSIFWSHIKKLYNWLPKSLRLPFALLVMGPRDLRSLLFSIITFRPMRYVRSWTEYGSVRGMSKWIDMIDWVGGYPFEVATPGQLVDFFRAQGFVLEKLVTCAGAAGCNEFVFSRKPVIQNR